MDKFYEHVMKEAEIIDEIVRNDLAISQLTPQQELDFQKATHCGNCNTLFSQTNHKVRHHCHVSGGYLFPCCNNCNLQLKAIKRSRKKAGVNVSTRGVPNRGFTLFGRFLSSSLDELVSLLAKAGKENFVHTLKHLGTDDDLVFSRGVYPYSHMKSRKQLKETELPPISKFHDSLRNEPLDPRDYERAKATWSKFDIQNLQQYHHHYLLTDVLLLTDVFEHFRNAIYEEHGIDCLHYPTLPSLFFDMALKHTDAQLGLMTDPEMYLMIENWMRGGIATISHRHSKANNPLVENVDDTDERLYIIYLDANSLYATVAGR